MVDSFEKGDLGLCHIKRYWWRSVTDNLRSQTDHLEQQLDQFVLDGLEISIRECVEYLLSNRPEFSEFEKWIYEKRGEISGDRRDLINSEVTRFLSEPHRTYPYHGITESPVFSDEDIQFWNENGYVVLKNAVERSACHTLEQAVWDHLGLSPDSPDNWNSVQENFWVSDFDHPQIDNNRSSLRITKAFEQLWGTDNLFQSVKRLSFNPPKDGSVKQFGPSNLHWDISIAQPVPYDMFGVLYLNDIDENQGAFQCIPGFHKRLSDWLDDLSEDAIPRELIVESNEAIKVTGSAGDLIICRQEIPHGSSVNTGNYPRFVQYIAMYPADREINPVWC